LGGAPPLNLPLTTNTSEEIMQRSNALMSVAHFFYSNLTHVFDFLNFLSLTVCNRTGVAPSRTGPRTQVYTAVLETVLADQID
jgi:hypothetical protein